MKATVFARPNLKLFLLFALLIAAAQHLMNASDSPEFAMLEQFDGSGPALSVINELVNHSLDHPSAETYERISEYYRQRGDTDAAMVYLRKAMMVAEIDDE